MKIPYNLKQVREITITKQELIDFEEEVEYEYNDGKIHCPVHLSSGNEEQLIEIFKYIHPDDWVFCSWRNHLEALLHGIPKEEVMRQIYAGQSLGVHHKNPKFYSSAIVGGIIPIALGTAKALKMKQDDTLNKNYYKDKDRKVWCFIGDMTFETGTFYENYKYATNFDLPLQFVVEDNNLSTYTETDYTWNYKKRDIPYDVIYYQYKSKWPHHGTGKWVNF
jgi:pyruvate dehydrogenase E1 component alpha subunit